MNISEFDNAIDAIEIDPRKRLKDSAKRILSSAVLADVPADLAARLVWPRLRQLFDRATVCLKAGDFAAIDEHLTRFRLDLTDAVGHERRDGELKPWNDADALKPWIGTFPERRWNGFECSHGRQLLPPGSRIVEVTFREWKLDQGRTITRADVRAFAESQRPAWARTVGDSEYFARNFTSEAAIKEAENAASRRELKRREISSGPAHLIGTLVD